MPPYKQFTPASPLASRIKQRNRREGGRAELLLGQALWRRGLRYRKRLANLPGKPDFVFTRAGVCVFCDGDFWHGRDWSIQRERLQRRANADYWVAKIGRNRERDVEQTQALEGLGWAVARVWETDILRNPDDAAVRVHELVQIRRRLAPSPPPRSHPPVPRCAPAIGSPLHVR